MFIDTSIIIDMLIGEFGERTERGFNALGASPVFISSIQIAETADWCITHGADTERRIAQLKDIASIIPLTGEMCVDGARIKGEMRGKGLSKFSLTDGLILASARAVKQQLLTMDTDFRKAGDDIVLIA